MVTFDEQYKFQDDHHHKLLSHFWPWVEEYYGKKISSVGRTSIIEDTKMGVDLWGQFTDQTRIHVPLRVRGRQYLSNYVRDFTVRTTELDKFLDGWGDIMIYAISVNESPASGRTSQWKQEPDILRAKYLGLKRFRDQYRPGMEGSSWPNKDGRTSLFSFRYDLFNPPVVLDEFVNEFGQMGLGI